MDEFAPQYDDTQRQRWWQQFLAGEQQRLQQQTAALHRMQPWQQPPTSRFQNPLVGSDAPSYGDRITDPQAAIMGYFMQQGGEGGGGMNPMLEQYLMTGNTGAVGEY